MKIQISKMIKQINLLNFIKLHKEEKEKIPYEIYNRVLLLPPS